MVWRPALAARKKTIQSVSMADPGGSITQAFRQMRQGDGLATRQVVERFFPRLAGLARKTLSGGPQAMADADDAVQSALVSFHQRIEGGQFAEILDRNDLWNVLATMTVHKSLEQLRRQRAAKRGGGKVLDEAALCNVQGEPVPLAETVAQIPSSDFDLYCEELIDMLADELRPIALLRLLGYRNREIAERLACTERRVERKLALIRLKWEDHVEQ
jgi:RNA polymerase sigma factor (sigma-70 family)